MTLYTIHLVQTHHHLSLVLHLFRIRAFLSLHQHRFTSWILLVVLFSRAKNRWAHCWCKTRNQTSTGWPLALWQACSAEPQFIDKLFHERSLSLVANYPNWHYPTISFPFCCRRAWYTSAIVWKATWHEKLPIASLRSTFKVWQPSPSWVPSLKYTGRDTALLASLGWGWWMLVTSLAGSAWIAWAGFRLPSQFFLLLQFEWDCDASWWSWNNKSNIDTHCIYCLLLL